GVGERVIPPTADWPRVETWPISRQEMPGIRAVRHILVTSTEALVAALVERLASDPAIPAADGLSATQLANHSGALFSLMAKTLSVLDEGGGDPTLLNDGEHLQDAVSNRHGLQRR